MPEISCSRSIPADAQTIWEFVENMDNWAPFIMGYQKHESIDDVRSSWTVKGELGALARTVDFDVTITEWAGPYRVLFTIKGATEAFEGNGGFHIGPNESAAYETHSNPPPSVSNAATSNAATSNAVMKRSVWRWVIGALFRRPPKVPSTGVPATSNTDESGQTTSGQTQFTFQLHLQAGGMTGPVVNVMLEPLMHRAADEFAVRLTEELLRRAAA